MPDYSKAKIYKITTVKSNQIYIGSTTQSLNSRYINHSCKINKCTSRLLFKLGECNIELILDYPCNNKWELELIEAYYIQKNNCVNHKSNKGSKTERQDKYREQNKDKKKEYEKKNKVKISDKYKKYYEKEKEYHLQRAKEYRAKNKDKIKEYRSKNKEYLKQASRFKRYSVFGQLCKLYNI